MNSQQILTATHNNDETITITMGLDEYKEVCYALQVLNKKRVLARTCQRRKYDKQREVDNPKRGYRKSMNLVIMSPVS